jgi:hypothetical protein
MNPFLFLLAFAYSKNFTSLVFVGYQGWFSNTIASKHWYHWSRNGGIPSPGNVCFDLYPDLSEYPKEALKETHLGLLGDNTPSVLYEADHQAVIDLHLKWMNQYGIDGLALQRFVNEIWNHDSETFKMRNGVLQKIIESSTKYHIYFYIAYDISGARADHVAEDIINDWIYLRNTFNLTENKYYVRQNNKPVLGAWGFGFKDRPGTVKDAKNVREYFNENNVYLMGGVPYAWRKQMYNGFDYSLAIELFDMIQPWSVGSFGHASDLNNEYHHELLVGDIQLCQKYSKDYQRVVWPGFSWSNWNNGSFNQIQRLKGSFIWEQVMIALNATLTPPSFMIAMFDEFDEGTAIAKAAPNSSKIPISQKFLTLDADGFALNSDHYLNVAKNITQYVHSYVPVNRGKAIFIILAIVIGVIIAAILYTIVSILFC